MPPSTVQAQQLRRRALQLRELAHLLVIAPVAALYRSAGPDTWIGPSASRCLDDLTPLGTRLAHCSDDLVRRARLLEQRADQLDAAAAAVGAR